MLVDPVRLTADVGCRRRTTTKARAPMRPAPPLVLYVSFPAPEPRGAAVEEPSRPGVVAADGR